MTIQLEKDIRSITHNAISLFFCLLRFLARCLNIRDTIKYYY